MRTTVDSYNYLQCWIARKIRFDGASTYSAISIDTQSVGELYDGMFNV